MKDKKLKPLTIIPTELYVERSADRQLAEIIDDMGRPGYVLVARQMGKTNLLLNARKKINSNGNLFAYIDASNPFPDVRSFFRNIIDTCLDTSNSTLSETKASIETSRIETLKPPHKEHESELREIVNAISGKLIICIDEIDALKKCGYSDQVFSFIRSLYFSGRANFEELYRATYILSGVAEPAEIIKNKDISPFNIGEKIYLEDFTLEEVTKLFKNSLIEIDRDSVAHLYSWCNGHPRITWDVASRIEDILKVESKISHQQIDRIIHDLYFSDIDTPPIDHIKKLAESNKDVRDALIAIHYERAESINENLKTRLYLFGITKAGADNRPPVFKNRIIEESLSEELLVALPTQSVNEALEQGKNFFSQGDYHLAQNTFLTITNLRDEKAANFARIWLGKTQFMLSEYENCIETLGNVSEEGIIGDQVLVNEVDFLLGESYYRISQPLDAISYLKRIVEKSSTDQYYDEAYVDYIDACTEAMPESIDSRIERDRCKSLLANRSLLINKLYFSRPATEVIAGLHINLGKLHKNLKEFDNARAEAQKGIEFANLDTKISVLVFIADLSSNIQRKAALMQCIALTSMCKGFTGAIESRPDTISVETLFSLLIRLSNDKLNSAIDEVISLIRSEGKVGLSPYAVLIRLSELAHSRNAANIGAKILESCLTLKDTSFSQKELRSLIRGIILQQPSRVILYANDFLLTFTEALPVGIEDLVPLNNIVLSGLNSLNASMSKAALSVFKAHAGFEISTIALENESYQLVAEYLRLMIVLSGKPNSGDLFAARSFHQRLQEIKVFSLPGFAENHVSLMMSQLVIKLKRHGASPAVKRGSKFGRNEIVTVNYSGSNISGKFKRFESDILRGVCTLIGRGTIKNDNLDDSV